MMIETWDVIVVGGGPAGLNAALVLGRCRRTVLVLDDAKPRNAASRALHGFLTRDGIPPMELRRIAREQLARYESVTLTGASVADAARDGAGFSVTTSDGQRFRARKLLLAGGVKDALPDIPGFQELYGAAVFHCPYCDGWEVRDQGLAIYGKGDDKGGGLALEMTLWSRDIVLCTDGPSELSTACRDRLARFGIPVREERIARLKPQVRATAVVEIAFENGTSLRRRALFFNTGRRQSSDLAQRLGCDTYEEAGGKVEHKIQATSVPGLYVAGDASRAMCFRPSSRQRRAQKPPSPSTRRWSRRAGDDTSATRPSEQQGRKDRPLQQRRNAGGRRRHGRHQRRIRPARANLHVPQQAGDAALRDSLKKLGYL